MALLKLGPHVLLDTWPGRQWAATANLVKALDHPALLAEAKALNPDCLTIHRHYFERQDIWRHGAEVAAEALNYCRGFTPDFVELFNEVDRYSGDRQLQLAAEAQPFVERSGSRVLALSGGTGWWEYEDWQRWRAAGYWGVKYVGLHEYWNGPFDGWNALRCQRVHEWTQGQHPLFVITECGRDALHDGEGRGWREQHITAEQYLGELLAYDAELQQDSYVVGATVFTTGPTGPHDDEKGFLGFDCDQLVPRILEMGTERRRLLPVEQDMIVPPGGGEVTDQQLWRLREHVSPLYELTVRLRQRVDSGDWAGAQSDAGEIGDRAAAIWQEFDLEHARP